MLKKLVIMNFLFTPTGVVDSFKVKFKSLIKGLFKILRAKMKNGEYESVEQMDADLTLMFENAKRYNMPNSSIYKRAFRLQQIMQVRTSASFTHGRFCCKMFSL